MAGACGNCHQGLQAEPRFTWDSLPSQAADVAAHLLRHQWVADRMWRGLIGPSDEAWNAGAEVLVEAPLRRQDLFEESDPSVEAAALASRVHELGAEARFETDADAGLTSTVTF